MKLLNIKSCAAIAGLLLLAGCGGGGGGTVYPDDDYARAPGQNDNYSKDQYDQGRILGSDGLALIGGNEEVAPGQGPGVGVNSFLWRASLDTVSFMPLSSADPFGGVIITDWYSPPETPNERFKVNIVILGRDLRADGVRASVFRQQVSQVGWIDAEVAPDTGRELEDAILTRARELRISQLRG